LEGINMINIKKHDMEVRQYLMNKEEEGILRGR
jgi:hypothetical protein